MPELQVEGMPSFLDSLKWDSSGLVAVVVQVRGISSITLSRRLPACCNLSEMFAALLQHVDTGEVLMQAFADRAAISETLQTGCVGARPVGV